MSKYHQQLREKYKLLPICSYEELLEAKSLHYIDLLLVKFDGLMIKSREQLMCGKLIVKKMLSSPDMKLVTLADVLNAKGEKKVILVEGGPGMGKSTLAIQICKCWADGELLEEYDAVILLPLRDPEIQAANNIGDLLLVENKNEREALYDEITASQGDKICFILEGYDELPNQLRNISVFAKLREKLPRCTIIYTSRPEACDQLRHVASQRIEIRGFKGEQVDEYINNAFENVEDGKEKGSKLISQVKSNPSIKNIMYIPINVAIVCHLFLLTSTLPSTLTELYTLLCLNLILRHINKQGLHSDKVDFLDNLNELPLRTGEHFSNLCLIAYRGRKDDQIIFSSREIKGYGIDPSKLSGLGLLMIAPSTSVYGREKSYNFLHLTVQEFCAAFHISKLPEKEQHKCFTKYSFCGNFQMIWRMYSGITRLRNKGIFHDMLPSKWVKSDYRKRRTVELLQCVYEAHDDELCHIAGDHLGGNIDLFLTELDQTGCITLGYLLRQHRNKLKFLGLWGCDIDDEGCRILLNSLLSHQNYSFKFEINLHGNKITDKSFSLLASLLLSNYPINKLDIGWNELTSSTDVIFKSLHHNAVLTELLLSRTSLRSSDMQSLGQMLTSNNTLSVMDISDNDIGPDGCQYLADCRNISLKKLIISRCKLGASGADSIGIMMCHNKSITSVDLGDNSIGDDGLEKLVEHLKPKTTEHLALQNNNITSDGANHLKRLLSINHLNSIELGKNLLKDKGIDLILQSVTTTVKYIGLADTGMTSSCCSMVTAIHKIRSLRFTLPDICDNISNSLTNDTVLEELTLCNGNNDAYHTIINGISRNNCIKKLEFCNGHLHYQTISALAHIIKFNKNVTELAMIQLDVSPSDYLLLAQALTVNSSIKKMRIWPLVEKKMNQSLVLQFLKQLKCNNTLEMLSLFGANDDELFIRDVEILVEDINNIRQSQGVTTPLRVML